MKKEMREIEGKRKKERMDKYDVEISNSARK